MVLSRYLKLTEQLPENVLAAQARLLHKQIPESLIGGTGVALCFLVLGSNQLQLATLIIWSVIYLLITMTRLHFYQRLKSHMHDNVLAADWARSAPKIFFLPGLCWGVMSSGLILTSEAINIWFIIALLAGLSSGAVGALAVLHRCFFVYSIFMLLPVVVALLLVDEWMIASLMALFFFMNNGFARNIYKANLNSIVTKFENELLIKKLESQRMELQEQNRTIQDAMRKADEANRSKSVFLASASHDLAQPLHSLKLFLAAIGQEMTSESQQSLLSKAVLCANNMSELFLSLLDISKLDAGAIELDRRHHDIAETIELMAMEFETQIREKDLQFLCSSYSCIVYSDQTIVQRVLRNLLHNALKYTKSGTITLAAEPENDGFVSISVSDTGPGIDSAELPYIFDEFYQINNPERDRNRGLGLGLAIVKRFSDLLEMNVKVDSSLDSGTSFNIFLPVANDIQAKSHQSPTEQNTDEYSSVRCRAAKILFIDDEEHTRHAMTIMLENLGHDVIATENLNQALDQLTITNTVPDLIISDYRLRNKKTGTQAITQLREEFNKDIPAMIITGDTGSESLKDINELSVEVLHKLSPHKSIIDKIDALLS